MSARIDVHDLYKRYGRIEALRGVSFGFGAGEIFGLLGPNGAGKTTALECLAGLREPDGGEVAVAGLGVGSRGVREKVGVMLQATALPDQLTAREALALFGSFYRERVEVSALLERFGLIAQADVRFDTMSGGQRQRLALALAFVNRPEVVILDEPTVGLDPQARRELHAEIRRMQREGCAVLLSTHYLEEARELCDRLAILDHGRVIACGTPEELITQTGGRQTVTLTGRTPIDAVGLARLHGVEALECRDFTARFQTPDATSLLPLLNAWIETQHISIQELHIGQATLEDVFLRLTQAEGHGGEER